MRRKIPQKASEKPGSDPQFPAVPGEVTGFGEEWLSTTKKAGTVPHQHPGSVATGHLAVTISGPGGSQTGLRAVLSFLKT